MYRGGVIEQTAVPLALPARTWQRPDVRKALQVRDVGQLLKAAQQHTGASQSRIAVAIGITQGRVSEIVRGTRQVTALDTLERIAVGLDMPDDARMLLGLAPVHPAGLDHLSASGRAEILQVFPSQSTARDEIQALAQRADQIDVLAVRGLGIVGLNDSLIRAAFRAGTATLRVQLLDPDSDAAEHRAAEIGEALGSFQAGIWLAVQRLQDLAADGAAVELHLYAMLPTWRVIGLDDTLFVSAFGENHEGHTSSMYRITGSPHGALHRGFRRFLDELRRTSRRVI